MPVELAIYKPPIMASIGFAQLFAATAATHRGSQTLFRRDIRVVEESHWLQAALLCGSTQEKR